MIDSEIQSYVSQLVNRWKGHVETGKMGEDLFDELCLKALLYSQIQIIH